MPAQEKAQVVLNLTNKQILRVNWPGYPTLFETAVYRVVQLVYLESATAWKMLVPVPSSANPPVHEITFVNWPVGTAEQ